MANAISSTATFWFLFLFIFCLFFFKGLNSPRWKWWASLLTLCRPLTWLKVEIWWLFLKFPIIWTVFLCVPKQNLASCCDASKIAFELRAPKELPYACVTNCLWCSFLQSPGEFVLGMAAALTQPLLHSSKLPSWQQAGTWVHTEGKYQDTPVPAAPYVFL